MKKKEEVIKYHAIFKGAVLACELNDKSDKFYNNSVEATINKLIKHWQNYKKIDLYSFSKEYEELIECQESDVLRGYLGLNGPYVVRKEFTNHKKVFNIEYASLSINEKQKIKKLLLNISVDLKSFTNISSFRASHNALKNVRTNMAKIISQDSNRYAVTSKCNTVASYQQGESSSASIEYDNAMDSLDGLMFILKDAPPEKEENIRSSVLQSVELVKNNDVMPAFAASQYIVKPYSRPNRLPHLVSCCENGLVKCDSNCLRCNSEGFFGHTKAVALKNKTVQSFASALSKCNEKQQRA